MRNDAVKERVATVLAADRTMTRNVRGNLGLSDWRNRPMPGAEDLQCMHMPIGSAAVRPMQGVWHWSSLCQDGRLVAGVAGSEDRAKQVALATVCRGSSAW